jgi:hypothetical protein
MEAAIPAFAYPSGDFAGDNGAGAHVAQELRMLDSIQEGHGFDPGLSETDRVPA